jgi:hypothetical protein
MELTLHADSVNVEKAKKGYDTNLEGMTGKESGFVKKTA